MKEKLERFVSAVFSDLEPDEYPLFWASSSSTPGYPISQDNFFKTYTRSKKEKACYFSPSTVHMHHDGKLYNRQPLFSKMFFIVLDDIGDGLGSKCSAEELPDILRYEYSWKTETSPGNYQYAYLLKSPICELEVAREFVKAVYAAGAWDSGGALPNKLVRLPCGYNLKEKYSNDNGLWRLEIEADMDLDNLNRFTPSEILEAVNAGVTWEDIQKGVGLKNNPKRRSGATAWREGVLYDNLDGVVDDVLEWLNESGLLLNESGEWFDIKCPWCDGHTDDEVSAGYKPLGYGENPERRGFHCFHDHCSTHHTHDFLSWVAENGGPTAPTVDPIPLLVSQWAFDLSTNTFIDMKQIGGSRIHNAGFKTGHQQTVFWNSAAGKPQQATQYALITKHDGLLKLRGSRYIPGDSAVIDIEGRKYYNNWHIPNWFLHTVPDNKYRHDVEMFTDFINYLIPYAKDSEWFIDHLAAKVQDPKYRGPCVILSTPAYGTGRSTLTNKILPSLWGEDNSSEITLSEMLEGFSGKGFNDWLQSVWITVREAKENTMSYKQELKAYESLKNGIDTQPTSHLLKTKYGAQWKENVYSSTIICSNHEDVLNIPVNDRRFLHIHCVVEPAGPDYFTALHEWLETEWEPSIWKMLSERDITHHNGFAPPNADMTKEEKYDRIISQLSGQSAIDRLVTLAILFAEEKCKGVLHTGIISDWIADYPQQFHIPAISGWSDIFKRGLQNATSELMYKNKRRAVRVGDMKCYARHTLNENGYKTRTYVENTGDFEDIKAVLEAYESKDFLKFVTDAFNEAGV